MIGTLAVANSPMTKPLLVTKPTGRPAWTDRIATNFEPSLKNTLWVRMARDPERQNFSLPLLDSLASLLGEVKAADGHWSHAGRPEQINYCVLKSDHPEFFSLGGDLRHFHASIMKRDSQALYNYSKHCLDILYAWATTLNGRATTISLVQGRALGGGFESALAADFIIAEEHSEFGFPEIMFGLFPCTGGMSLLGRRIGVFEAERMMTNARIYTARELKDMGIIDEVCEKGEGELAVERFIKNHAKHGEARKMLQKSRYRLAPLNYDELLTVVGEWVDVAMRLPEEELRAMEMLSLMQGGR